MRPSVVFLSWLVFAASAGATDQPDRPKVGLVLSGGGALGSAHVGVLKVLDELRVPIHCVAGTSMGAVVGGLYAAGYSPEELEDTLLEIDWHGLLDDRPPRRLVPFRRKVDDLTFLTRLEMGFNGGRFQLPSALIQGQKLDFLLQALTVHTVGVASFDELPIPFRAVATDLETGAEEHVPQLVDLVLVDLPRLDIGEDLLRAGEGLLADLRLLVRLLRGGGGRGGRAVAGMACPYALRPPGGRASGRRRRCPAGNHRQRSGQGHRFHRSSSRSG